MLDCLKDAIIDTLHIVPFLFVTFILLELIEHRVNKNKKTGNKKFGPILGAFLGVFPQCGFSAVASNLYSSRVITMGTIIAVFLSTSDEMLPIMLSEHTAFKELGMILLFKLVIAIIIGLLVDLIIKPKKEKLHVHELCEHDHCDCEHHGIVMSSLIHTLKITLFILIANFAINLLIDYIGETALTNMLLGKNIFKYLVAALFGLIPNCAASVIITQVYLSNLITIGTLLAGLLPGAGIGILLLFKQNKNLKENLTIISIIYLTGVLFGILIDAM